jgi:small neutral amino acid transporter SnatA (MarC family)
LSVAFLVAAFLATANAGRLARVRAPVLPALLAGFGAVAAVALLADELLDRLAVSPESFRIAAGLVLAVAGLRGLVGAISVSGPYSAVITPELALLAVSAGADEPTGKVLTAAAIAFAVGGLASVPAGRRLLAPAARFLSALQVVVGVALVVSGVQDV